MKRPKIKPISISKFLPRTSKPASSPGTVKYFGKKRDEVVKLALINYGEDNLVEKELSSLEECMQYMDMNHVTWLNVTGVHDENIIKDIGKNFNLHPLVLEDIANTTQGSKAEDFDKYLFIILKMTYFDKEGSEVTSEQISLIAGENYVISLQEREFDILDGLRDRLRQSKGRIRKMGADYLMYAIIDAVVDNYYIVLEQIGEKIEEVEDVLVKSANQEVLVNIYRLKRELVILRKSIWPMREVVNMLKRAESKLIGETAALYLRDVYDHTVQVVETVETFRDMASGMLDLYLSTNSNKMNEIMKVLTIFAAIFIPLTFIAGVYGMNFEFMPELHEKWAYPAWWAITLALGLGMVIYFKRKKWL